MKAWISGAPVFFLIIACASEPKHVVEEIETEVEFEQDYGEGRIGVNEDGEAIIQRENTAAVELAMQKQVNSMLKNDLVRAYSELDACLTDLADPRLGGNGKVQGIEELADLEHVVAVNEKIGITEDGYLKVVKETRFVEELKAARQYESSLRTMSALVAKHARACERERRTARIRHGLPADRIEPKGYFAPDGTWVEIRRGERTLDDAFELTAQKRAPSLYVEEEAP